MHSSETNDTMRPSKRNHPRRKRGASHKTKQPASSPPVSQGFHGDPWGPRLSVCPSPCAPRAARSALAVPRGKHALNSNSCKNLLCCYPLDSHATLGTSFAKCLTLSLSLCIYNVYVYYLNTNISRCGGEGKCAGREKGDPLTLIPMCSNK